MPPVEHSPAQSSRSPRRNPAGDIFYHLVGSPPSADRSVRAFAPDLRFDVRRASRTVPGPKCVVQEALTVSVTPFSFAAGRSYFLLLSYLCLSHSWHGVVPYVIKHTIMTGSTQLENTGRLRRPTGRSHLVKCNLRSLWKPGRGYPLRRLN